MPFPGWKIGAEGGVNKREASNLEILHLPKAILVLVHAGNVALMHHLLQPGMRVASMRHRSGRMRGLHLILQREMVELLGPAKGFLDEAFGHAMTNDLDEAVALADVGQRFCSIVALLRLIRSGEGG